MSNNVKLQVLLRAVDQASRPFKSIRTASKSLSGDIRETQKSLRELNGHASRIEGFRKTSAQLAVTGQELKKPDRKPQLWLSSLKILNDRQMHRQRQWKPRVKMRLSYR